MEYTPIECWAVEAPNLGVEVFMSEQSSPDSVLEEAGRHFQEAPPEIQEAVLAILRGARHHDLWMRERKRAVYKAAEEDFARELRRLSRECDKLIHEARKRMARRRGERWRARCEKQKRVLAFRAVEARRSFWDRCAWIANICIALIAFLALCFFVRAWVLAPGRARQGELPPIAPGGAGFILPDDEDDKAGEVPCEEEPSMENQGVGPGTPVQVDLGPGEEIV